MPYPPNKGDKIRSYHLLAHLAQRFKVHLGTFVDDTDDWRHADTVRHLCATAHIAALHPMRAKLRSLRAFAAGQALTLDYYRDAAMQAWVEKTVAEYGIHRVVVFSSGMAQYAEGIPNACRIIDFIDVDSDKWVQYADTKPWPLSWLYRREGQELLRYERRVAREFDASLFVSAAEAGLFRKLAPESAARIGHMSNGVDTAYFSPERSYDNPYSPNEAAVVFTGAMDYWPNIDAVQWFAETIMPAVRERNEKAMFYIVGARPTQQVKNLEQIPGVKVTGAVDDVRPYIAHAKVAVAPLRIARGIQNKVLEAMAMGKSVVVSPAALEGIDAAPGREILLAGDDTQYVNAVTALLTLSLPEIGRAARRKVVEQYGWASHLRTLDTLLDVPAGEALQPLAGERA